MNAYSGFASVYDDLMKDVEYDKWQKNIEKVILEMDINVKEVLELACGTANMALRFSKLGYRVTGVDISDEMLSIAKGKALSQHQKIDFFNQDISEIKFNKKFDLVISVCDGINYIISDDKIKKLFSNVYDCLNENGLFIFDISSKYKLKNILGNNNICESGDDISFIWENYYDDDKNILEFDLSIFIKNGEIYKRYDEFHTQRAYEVDEIKNFFNEKFSLIKSFDEDYKNVREDTERIFFVLKKKI